MWHIHISGIQFNNMILIGAFRFTGLSKYELMWEKNSFRKPAGEAFGMRELFEEEQEVYTLPQFREVPHEQAFDEIELLGFPLSSPFELIKEEPPEEIPAARLTAYEGKDRKSTRLNS